MRPNILRRRAALPLSACPTVALLAGRGRPAALVLARPPASSVAALSAVLLLPVRALSASSLPDGVAPTRLVRRASRRAASRLRDRSTGRTSYKEAMGMDRPRSERAFPAAGYDVLVAANGPLGGVPAPLLRAPTASTVDLRDVARGAWSRPGKGSTLPRRRPAWASAGNYPGDSPIVHGRRSRWRRLRRPSARGRRRLNARRPPSAIAQIVKVV